MDSKEFNLNPKPNKRLPEGCTDKSIHKTIRSSKCICKEKKDPFASFCNRCYKALSPGLREDLWVPWKDGFQDLYEDCIAYLERTTERLKCRADTPLFPTSISNSGPAKKKNSGTTSQANSKQKKQTSVSAQGTLLVPVYQYLFS